MINNMDEFSKLYNKAVIVNYDFADVEKDVQLRTALEVMREKLK